MRYLSLTILSVIISLSAFAALPPITGTFAICDGGTTTLSNPVTGGTWSSSNPTIATIGVSSGIVTGISSGTSMITYTDGIDFAFATVTVNPLPSVITGSTTMCAGTNSTLANATSGGTWSSSTTTVATVAATTGVVNGVSAGTATISYTLATGCSRTTTILVNASPTAITGTTYLCVSGTTTLGCTPSGGTWTGSAPGVFTVSPSTGVVTGVSVGSATVSYTISSGCSSTATMYVNASGTISGTATLCGGSTTTLATTSGPGGTWSSSATGVATVGTAGVVLGVGVGTATISYATASCGTATRVVTVTSSCSGTPVTGAITASSSIVCSGTPLVLNLPAYTPVCGNVIQWQYSTDGLSWSNLAGANSVPYVFFPTAAYYYRCGITCISSGLTGYSGPLFVGINFSIGAYNVISAPSTTCDPTHFYVSACGVSPTFSVATWFGDGSNTTTTLSTATLSDAHIYHTYTLPGTYTIKHILFNGVTPVDTVIFNYNHVACNILPIQFYKDNNGNCIKDGGDLTNLTPVSVRVDSSGVTIDTITATSGFSYKALGPVGTIYAFRPLPMSLGMTVGCPASGVIYDTIVATTNTYVAKRFGINCLPTSAFDVAVDAAILSGRHTQRLTITVRNTYCTSTSPVLTLDFNPKYGYYPTMWPCSNTTPSPTTVSGTTMTWNLGPMLDNDVRMFTVYLERLGGPGMWLIPGDTVLTTISVSPTVGDATPVNNTLVRIDTVKSSFDPNDIAVSPEGYVLPCTKLQYRVRFENTGNDTARNVYVLDTLSADLDASSLAVEMASAPMYVSVINSGGFNIAKFDFPNINLLDTSHPNRNDGMFIFNIKAKSSLVDGTVIPQRVGIYFDDNPVVLTNTVNNIIGIAPIVGPANVCLGYPAQFTNATAGGVWVSSTSSVATVTTIGAVSGVIAGTSTISYTVTNSCTSRTATAPINVAAVVTPSVSITSSVGDTVCAGSSVIFTAVPTLGGTIPDYTWRVNGITVGGTGSYTFTPTAGDTLSVSLASSEACAMPAIVADTMPLTVVNMETPSVSLSVAPGVTICSGSLATFTALPVYGGTTPGYLWYVNGALSAAGTATFSYPPVNGDIVYCRMGSDFICRLADSVNSSTVGLTVDPLYIPIISISASPSLYITAGDALTLTAGVTGAGPSPTYQWLLNGFEIPGATNSTYTSTTFDDYDSVACRVTGSGICNISSFNSVYVTVYPVGVVNVAGGDELHIFPNPNNGGFMISGAVSANAGTPVAITINNVLGQVVYNNYVITGNNGSINEPIQLPNSIADGVYMLNIRSGNENRMYRIVVNK